MKQTDNVYDVLVVGSGASGGWAVKRLAEAGIKVALPDAGRPHGPNEFTEHKHEFELKYRDQAPEIIRRTRPRQKDCYACTEFNYDWFANDLEEPYTTPGDKPFSWQGRMRIHRWPHQRMGPPELPLERGRISRRPPLTATGRIGRSAMPISHRTTFGGRVCRDQRPSGGCRGAARRQVSPADGHDVPRCGFARG